VGPPVGPHDLAGYPSGAVGTGWDQVVQGPGTWGALAVGPGEELEFAIICADSEKNLGQLLDQTAHVSSPRFFQMLEGMVTRRHAPAQQLLEKIRNPRVRELCERSIDVLHSLQDGETGALMAAAEVDPHSKMSGGYGYSWPRDGAYLAAALGQWGFRDRVEHYFKFCAETQDPSGAWWQRYLATGNAGPSWGRIQIDEPASVISAAWLHYRNHEDLFWLEGFWPVIQKGLSFLESFHAPIHPMGQPSHDLWEERMGIHAYSLAAVASAFRAGAALAGELGEREAQDHYAGWDRNLTSLVLEKFVPPTGPIRRSFVVNSFDYQRGGGYWDEVADASMLGLILPFGILRVQDQAAQRLIESVRTRLWSRPVGGLLRYEGDTYRGGNPWVLTTLWLAGVELAGGNAEAAREGFQWVMSKNTPLGMMPEQVHRETGLPCWVIPLGWSHAMFLLFVRQVIDMKAENKIWESL
jgi:GH15 family glucan-1,4-alpha-glucosidase